MINMRTYMIYMKGKRIMKKTVMILLAISLLLPLVLCSCGKEDKKVEPMSVIGAKAIEKRDCEDDPVIYTADDLVEDLGLGTDLYEDFYFSYAGDFVSVETIAVFKAKDGKASELEGKLKAKQQSLINESRNYNEKNYQMATDAKIKTVNGKYVYMVVSPNASEIVKTIEEFL